MTKKSKNARNEPLKCQYRIRDGDKPCGRELYDGKFCIFHSEDIEGKRDKFKAKFNKDFEKQKKKGNKYDFSGFVFPEIDFQFTDIFDKDVSFWHSKFLGKVTFYQSIFYGEAKFQNAHFFKNVNFRNCHFNGDANFENVQFYEKTHFNKIKFKKTDFSNAEFSKVAYFSNCEFLGEFNSLTMLSAYFNDVVGLFEFIEKNKKKFKYSKKTKFLPDNFKLILGEKSTARYPTISREIRDDMYLLRFKEKHPFWHCLWWLFADCGRGFLRWALWSILVASIFAIIYHNCFYLSDHDSFNVMGHINKTWSCFSFLYYSIVTFTTLGFGDIVPNNGWLQFWVTFEVIIGYIMLGVLISILANKLARRS